MKSYPLVIRNVRVGTGRNHRKTCPECLGGTPYGYDVQWNYMRGDDDRQKMCGSCQASKTDEELINLVR